ncbi:MAG: hypothetical protein ABL907_24270 [Hyphomicrobium sp.]
MTNAMNDMASLEKQLRGLTRDKDGECESAASESLFVGRWFDLARQEFPGTSEEDLIDMLVERTSLPPIKCRLLWLSVSPKIIARAKASGIDETEAVHAALCAALKSPRHCLSVAVAGDGQLSVSISGRSAQQMLETRAAKGVSFGYQLVHALS